MQLRFLFIQCNYDFLAKYLHHNHILPGLFNICSRFNYNSPTGFSVFRINQSPHQPVPGQSARNPTRLRASSSHTCEACYLQAWQDIGPLALEGPPPPRGPCVSIIRAVMTDSIRSGIWEVQSWPVRALAVFYER